MFVILSRIIFLTKLEIRLAVLFPYFVECSLNVCNINYEFKFYSTHFVQFIINFKKKKDVDRINSPIVYNPSFHFIC